MPQSFAERVNAAIAASGCCGVVNIDPVFDRLPKSLRTESSDPVPALIQFGEGVVDAVAGVAPIVKFNIAYFERYGAPGLDGYRHLIAYAHQRRLLVIGDVKRGDVGHTAEQYAGACFSNGADDEIADAVTINGYFGWDGVKPFVDQMRSKGRGVFVLVRTSNASAATIQDLTLADGRKVHEAVGSLVNAWSIETSGGGAYGDVGAVVATRDRADATRLRQVMPNTIFLVPGYGAQGGAAEDFRPYLDANGLGALIAAGRSVIYAYGEPARQSRFGDDWKSAVGAACREFAEDLARIMPRK
ncbi:MAG TPA: orotidine-5'-phosphate decarboxylase [Phycisphaerae bacterium]|nr:orotidine-5'-phosphate decarboxylase [Phycisphaerae bacterium]HRW54488.1 orotidine-5'-phosphate decarboxylase [Phycisphaerae bacterium]